MNFSARTHHPSYHARASGTYLVVDNCYLCATTGERRKSALQATNRDNFQNSVSKRLEYGVCGWKEPPHPPIATPTELCSRVILVDQDGCMTHARTTGRIGFELNQVCKTSKDRRYFSGVPRRCSACPQVLLPHTYCHPPCSITLFSPFSTTRTEYLRIMHHKPFIKSSNHLFSFPLLWPPSTSARVLPHSNSKPFCAGTVRHSL